jgi:hypothetical protein
LDYGESVEDEDDDESDESDDSDGEFELRMCTDSSDDDIQEFRNGPDLESDDE